MKEYNLPQTIKIGSRHYSWS